MRSAAVDLELFAHGAAKAVLGEHPADGPLDGELGTTREKMPRRLLPETAGITRVSVVDLITRLIARQADLRRVDDDDEIAGIRMRSVGRTVLAAEDLRHLRCEAAERDARGVDDEPLTVDFAAFCALRDAHDAILPGSSQGAGEIAATPPSVKESQPRGGLFLFRIQAPDFGSGTNLAGTEINLYRMRDLQKPRRD